MSTATPVTVVRLGPGDAAVVHAGADLFDAPPTAEWTDRFLARDGHHLLVALAGDRPVGFVSGVETTHPDKGTEMFLYELAVHPGHRRQGTGRALVEALRARACAAATACGSRPTRATTRRLRPTGRPAPSRPSPA